MPDHFQPPASDRLHHDLINYLTTILGFCELLLAELPETGSARADALEIQKAAAAAMTLLRQLPLPPQ